MLLIFRLFILDLETFLWYFGSKIWVLCQVKTQLSDLFSFVKAT